MSATVNKLVYGDLTFTDDEIQDGEVYDAVALLSDALEIGTLNVGLYIRDEETGAALTAFRRNEKLLYYYRDKLRGTYYIESIQRTGKYTYEISANNAVALLEQSNHLGGIYTGQAVDELVAEICTIPYIIQSKFAGIKLYGWLPVATRRANLAQVLLPSEPMQRLTRTGCCASNPCGMVSPTPSRRIESFGAIRSPMRARSPRCRCWSTNISRGPKKRRCSRG